MTVQDASGWRVKCVDRMQLRFHGPYCLPRKRMNIQNAVRMRGLMNSVQGARLIGICRDYEFSNCRCRDAVALAEFIQKIAPADAEFRLLRADWIVKAGMNNFAVASAGFE